jgi:hypothetical protein
MRKPALSYISVLSIGFTKMWPGGTGGTGGISDKGDTQGMKVPGLEP